jgi:hypothetical protein
VEVGNLDDGNGNALGCGMYLDPEGDAGLFFVELTEDEARTFGARVYQTVTITITPERS